MSNEFPFSTKFEELNIFTMTKRILQKYRFFRLGRVTVEKTFKLLLLNKLDTLLIVRRVNIYQSNIVCL